jgi:hypothetical protein
MIKTTLLFFAFAAAIFAGNACPGLNSTGSMLSVPWNGYVAGSATSTYRQDITNAAVDPNSATWLASPSLGNHDSVYPGNGIRETDINFGGSAWEGMTIHYVRGTQRRIVIRDNPAGRESYPGDGDPGTFPVPAKARIQGWYGPFSRPWDGPFLDRYFDPHALNGGQMVNRGSDQHIMVVDVDNCIDYEAYSCYDDGSNISCAAYSAFYLPGGDRQRPYNTTGGGSVSGMPIVFGMLKPDEYQAGVINHALTASFCQGCSNTGMTGPATHAQCCNGNGWSSTGYIPFGAKVRLKPQYTAVNLGLPASCQPILSALQKYGLLNGDGGASADLYPVTSFVWPTDCAPAMRGAGGNVLPLDSTHWDVIQSSTPTYCVYAQIGCPGGSAPTGSAPAISAFTASPSTITAGQSTTLHWVVSGVVDADGNAIPLRNISYSPSGATPVQLSNCAAPPAGTGGGGPCMLNKFGPGWIVADPHIESVIVTPPSSGTYTYQLMVQNQYGRTTAGVTVTVN